MCERSADSAFEGIVERLRSARSLLALTHARPDGDGLGSMAALVHAARAAGKKAHALIPNGFPARYGFLFPEDRPARAGRFAALADSADVIVILDTRAFAQMESLEAHLRARTEKIIVLDHHITTDDVGAVQWTDTSAAAVGVMIAEVIEALGWGVDCFTAEALMTAVTTDTGWLRFANADARALRAVARWIEAGVRPDVLYRKIYQTDRPQRLMLIARALESLELFCDGQLAAMTLRRSDFEATGATQEETENLVNEALRLKTVETALLLVDSGSHIRVSLRSRDRINVAELARRFGGGGHARAAGLRIAENIDVLKERLVAACAEELAKARR